MYMYNYNIPYNEVTPAICRNASQSTDVSETYSWGKEKQGNGGNDGNRGLAEMTRNSGMVETLQDDVNFIIKTPPTL